MKMSKRSKPEGSFNEYSDTDYTLSDSEAHRDVSYMIPSPFKQILTVILMHIKLFSKDKMFIGLIILVMLIPVGVYSGLVDKLISDPSETIHVYSSGDYAGFLLGLLPMMIALIPATMMSKSIPSEFRNRTAYMNLALPQSRMTFFFGKFIAGMIIVTFAFVLTYGIVIVLTTINSGSLDAGSAICSFIVTIFSCFAIGATTIALSTFMKKGSTMLTFMFFYIVLPLAIALIGVEIYSNNTDGMINYLLIMQYLPSTAGDVGISMLGSPMTPLPSLTSMWYAQAGIVPNFSFLLDITAYAFWGMLFLILGYVRFERREI